MTQHLGDDAELYPLGILDEDAAGEVERHIATCVPCAARVTRAQLTAAQLATGFPAATPSPALERRIADSLRALPGTAESAQASGIAESAKAPNQVFGAANERLGRPARSLLTHADTATNRSSFAVLSGSLALAAGLALAVIALGWQTLAFRARVASDDLALSTIVHSHFNHVAMTPESAHPVAAKVLYARDGSWLYIIADEPGGVLHVKVRTRSAFFDLGTLRSSGRVATLLERPPERIEAVTLERNGAEVASAALIYGK